MPAREPLGVFHEDVAHAIDALEQREVDAAHLRHRHEAPDLRRPDEGVGGLEVRGRGRLRHQRLERVGDAAQGVGGLREIGRCLGHAA